jgi:hypothetical protein
MCRQKTPNVQHPTLNAECRMLALSSPLGVRRFLPAAKG